MDQRLPDYVASEVEKQPPMRPAIPHLNRKGRRRRAVILRQEKKRQDKLAAKR